MSLLLPALVGWGTLSMGWAGWTLARLFLRTHSIPSFPHPRASLRLPPILKIACVLAAGLTVLGLLGPWAALAVLILFSRVIRAAWGDLRASFLRGRTASKLREVFPQALGMAVQALRTGQTVPQTLAYLSQECAPPLKQELSQVCAEIGLGASADLALAHLAERQREVPEFSRFLESYRLSRTTGANLGHLLQTLLEGMEEKARLMRRMEAMTAQARLSGLLMGLLPVILGTTLFWMDPDLMKPLFTQKAGWAILALAAFLEGLGFLWIRHLLRLEF